MDLLKGSGRHEAHTGISDPVGNLQGACGIDESFIQLAVQRVHQRHIREHATASAFVTEFSAIGSASRLLTSQ